MWTAGDVALLSLIVVNFNTSGQLLRCLESLDKQEAPGWADDSPRWLETLVVDNASRPGERELLRALPPAVHVIQNAENVGYARAVNQGIADTRGEFVAILNPDTLALPGALRALLDVLRADPRVGAVGPRTWWEEGRTFWLPPLPLATLPSHVLRWVASAVPSCGRALSRRTARSTAALWGARQPTPVPNLPGSFLVTRRRVLETVGGFDPRFPLYFEDTDWCRRVARAGFGLRYVPAAEVVHFFNQSAQQIPETARQWLLGSERTYLEKHYGRMGTGIQRLCATLAPRVARRTRPRPIPTPIEIGPARDPLTLDVSDLPRPLFLQVSLHWLFLDAVFTVWGQPTCPLPAALWSRLERTRYYARALDRRTFHPLRVWTWEKI
jgi:GT2 family glycosyltransferase